MLPKLPQTTKKERDLKIVTYLHLHVSTFFTSFPTPARTPTDPLITLFSACPPELPLHTPRTTHSTPIFPTSKLKNMFFRTRILCPVVKWQRLHLNLPCAVEVQRRTRRRGGGQRKKEVCRSTDNEGNLVGICAACRSVSSTEQPAQRRVRIRLSTCVLTTRTHYHLASTSSILFS